MRPGLAAPSRLTIGLLAFAGVLSAHWLAYFLSAPALHEREHLLASTGHGDWSLVGAIGLGALTAALAGIALGCLRTGSSRLGTTGVAGRLALIQTTGFLVLETTERAAAAGGSLDALTEPVVGLGVVVQVVVAIVGAYLIRFFAAAVERLISPRAAARRRAPRLAGSMCETRISPAPRPRIASESRTLRGPPPAPLPT
jgi:hypothetical protein